jgi:hypothetical protein
MKRINQILKSLNFPKFYEKCTEENGSINYLFDNFAEREYSYNECKSFLDNLPTTEEDIHKDDKDLIVQFLEYHMIWDKPKDVKKFLQKLVDNKTSNISPKIDSILKHFESKFKVKRSKKDSMKDLQENLNSPVTKILEVIAGELCKTLETNKTEEVKTEEAKTEVETEETEPKAVRCKFEYTKKSSNSDLIGIIEILPYKEADVHNKDVKDIEKFLLYCVKVSKSSKKVKKVLVDYMLKVLDNTTLGEVNPKLEKMLGSPKLGKIVRKKLDKDDKDSRLSDFDQDDKIRKLEKENKKLHKAFKLIDKKVNKNHRKKPSVF